MSVIFLVFSFFIYTSYSTPPNCCSWTIGRPSVFGAVALAGILVDLRFQVFGTTDDYDDECEVYFGWEKNRDETLALNIAINENGLLLSSNSVAKKFSTELINNSNNIKNIIKDSIDDWETKPEQLCNNENINLKLNIKDNESILNNGIGLGQCQIKATTKDEWNNCKKPVSDNIQIYIAGFVNFGNYLDNSDSISGIVGYFDENNNMLIVTEQERSDFINSQGFKTNKIFKKISYVEIYLNSNYKWGKFNDGDKLPKGQLDIKSVVLHELAHTFIYKLHSNNVLNDFVYGKGKRLIDNSISNPNVGEIAKQTLSSSDVRKFCREFGSTPKEQTAAHMFKTHNIVKENNVENVSQNKDNNNNNNNNYILFLGFCIVFLLIANIFVQYFTNVKQKSSHMYTKA